MLDTLKLHIFTGVITRVKFYIKFIIDLQYRIKLKLI